MYQLQRDEGGMEAELIAEFKCFADCRDAFDAAVLAGHMYASVWIITEDWVKTLKSAETSPNA